MGLISYTAVLPLHPYTNTLLGLSSGHGVVHTRAGGSPGRHAAARHALEHALELRRAVREAVAPEAVAGVLDELDEGDEETPLFFVRRTVAWRSGGGVDLLMYFLKTRKNNLSHKALLKNTPPWE